MEKNKSNSGVIVILVIIILALLILVGLTGMGIVSFNPNGRTKCIETKDNNTSNNNVKEDDSSNIDTVSQKSSVSTSQILSYYKERVSMNNDSNHQYSVIDINNDKIPELFIYVTGSIGNQIVSDISIYTYDENKGSKSSNYIVYVGMISGRIDTNTVLYKMNDGKLLSVYGHMGYESTTYYKLENDWLVRTDFSSKETEDYMTGDNEIKFSSCNDTSLIDNYS